MRPLPFQGYVIIVAVADRNRYKKMPRSIPDEADEGVLIRSVVVIDCLCGQSPAYQCCFVYFSTKCQNGRFG
jgi:hypothetical protein